MKKENKEFIDGVYNNVLEYIDDDPIMKNWYNSLDQEQRAGLEAYSKALISTVRPPKLEPIVIPGQSPKADLHYLDMSIKPAPEIILPKDDLKPVKPMELNTPDNPKLYGATDGLPKQCSVDELPKNNPKFAKKMEEFIEKKQTTKLPSKSKMEKLIKAVEDLYDPKYNTTTVNGYDFVCTCHACPEQYDVYKGSYKDGNQVAYIRKRWGYLAVHPVKNGQIDWNITIYDESTGDGYSGSIDNRDEVFDKIVNILNNLPY